MSRLKASLDSLVARLSPCLIPLKKRRLILCYHRLADIAAQHSNPFYNVTLTTPIKNFEQQIRWLSSFCRFTTLDQLHQPNNSQQWQVAITFDDGYRDNLTLGLPILEQYQVPITLFSATAYTEDPELIPWWDICNYLMNVPTTPALQQALTTLSTGLDFPTSVHSDLHIRLSLALQKLNTQGPLHQAQALNQQLLAALNNTGATLNNDMLSCAELQAFAASPWVDIGAHTHTHPNMALLTGAQQQSELVASLNCLKQWGITPSAWFAYPFGKRRNYTDETLSLLSSLGLKGALTTDSGYITAQSNAYRLPRFSIDGRWSLPSFKARLLAGPFLKSLQKAA